MAWVRIDEEFADHPKVMAAGPLGMAMQVAALCYANRYLTDGFIPHAAASKLLNLDGLGMRIWSGEISGGGENASWQLIIEDLVAAGMWVETEGGWRIHDYEDYQPSRADVEADRDAARERMRRVRANGRQNTARRSAAVRLNSDESSPNPDTDTDTEEHQNPMPPAGGEDGEIHTDDPSATAEQDRIVAAFGEFWAVYPPTNGRKPEKGKALAVWRRLSWEQRRRAVAGARNLASSDHVPKYAHRFLRRDTAGEFPFDDWLEPSANGHARASPAYTPEEEEAYARMLAMYQEDAG